MTRRRMGRVVYLPTNFFHKKSTIHVGEYTIVPWMVMDGMGYSLGAAFSNFCSAKLLVSETRKKLIIGNRLLCNDYSLVFQSYFLRLGVWMVCFWGPVLPPYKAFESLWIEQRLQR